MPALHDTRYKAEVLRRLKALRPDTERRWGKMSVAQMLWHVNEAMEGALGRIAAEPARNRWAERGPTAQRWGG